jgi:hypothetical protein
MGDRRDREVFGSLWWGVIAVSGLIAVTVVLIDGEWWGVLLLPPALGAAAMMVRAARMRNL